MRPGYSGTIRDERNQAFKRISVKKTEFRVERPIMFRTKSEQGVFLIGANALSEREEGT
jgi:hypothetical protein